MYTSIPNLHVSSKSKAKGTGTVKIFSRVLGAVTGTYTVTIDVSFDPAGVDNYPAGPLTIRTDLTDGINGTFTATSIELINSYGKDNPTIYLVGRCNYEGTPPAGTLPPRGCKYWVMIANNKTPNSPATASTADIVGFCIIDRNGNRVNYGTGPLINGDIDVTPM